jgi:hypothetical protein
VPFTGERGEGTLAVSAFIFNVLGSAVWDGAPNFPPHGLVTIGNKSTKSRLKYQELAGKNK